jgi:hypothetical protein
MKLSRKSKKISAESAFLTFACLMSKTPSETQEINGGIWPILIKLGLTAALLIAGTQTAK